MYFSNDRHRAGLKQILVVSEGGIGQKVRETYFKQRSELLTDTCTKDAITIITFNNYN